MPRRAPRASGVADRQPTAAPVRAHFSVYQLVHHADEIVTAWRLWRAWPRADAVGLILDAIVSFEAIVNPDGLGIEQWQRGECTVKYTGPRAAGVAICGMGEAFFDILQRLQLTSIVGGSSIVEGTLDEERLHAVENAVDSLEKLAEILRAAPAVSGEVSPAEIPSEELIGRVDPYEDLQQFAERELRGQEREFLLLTIESMRQEPTVGLRFATLAQRYRHPNFDCVEYSKNKLGKLRSKINQSGLKYRLRQQDNAAIVECFSKE